MNLKKYNNLENFFSLQKNIDNLFNLSLFNEDYFWKKSDVLKVNISDKDNQYWIEAECPGLSSKDITVEVHDDILTISGEKKSSTEEEDRTYHKVEFSYGSFKRSFKVPQDFDTKTISAKFDNGLLKISANKSEVKKIETSKIKIEDVSEVKVLKATN